MPDSRRNLGFSPVWCTEARLEPGCEGKYQFMHIPNVRIVWDSEHVAFIWARPSVLSYPLKPHGFGSSIVADLRIG